MRDKTKQQSIRPDDKLVEVPATSWIRLLVRVNVRQQLDIIEEKYNGKPA